jgi:hypothetical protein
MSPPVRPPAAGEKLLQYLENDPRLLTQSYLRTGRYLTQVRILREISPVGLGHTTL